MGFVGGIHTVKYIYIYMTNSVVGTATHYGLDGPGIESQ
jgi:hypothetical protein